MTEAGTQAVAASRRWRFLLATEHGDVIYVDADGAETDTPEDWIGTGPAADVEAERRASLWEEWNDGIVLHSEAESRGPA